MRVLTGMIDLKKTENEKAEDAARLIPSASNQPDYPYGLCISLCQDELEKLNLDIEDVERGDMIHLHCMAIVTSISTYDREPEGPGCRLELQITHMEAEDEATEDKEDEEAEERSSFHRLYKA